MNYRGAAQALANSIPRSMDAGAGVRGDAMLCAWEEDFEDPCWLGCRVARKVKMETGQGTLDGWHGYDEALQRRVVSNENGLVV